ncbi:hypothetical protein F183_A31160 [Bryobacterales bacterium F-183]|nr:hypothetical protein F183_A31160 [Bryobacterales bacterium F-183]
MVAMARMRMMQVAVHQIIDMVSMRHRFMSATRAMDVVGGMRATGMIRSAGGRILSAHTQHMLINMAIVRRMQMPIVEIVHMPVMQDCGMPAARAMGVIVIFVDNVTHLVNVPFTRAGDSLACASALNTRSTMC